MAHRIQIARAWCDEHLAQCWHSHDLATGANEHLGESNAAKWQELKDKGYQVSHRGGVFTFTLWKAAPLALPLDWQMVRESKEPEYIQDW
jgi:hypothetical protein